jgi:hypothetical protein
MEFFNYLCHPIGVMLNCFYFCNNLFSVLHGAHLRISVLQNTLHNFRAVRTRRQREATSQMQFLRLTFFTFCLPNISCEHGSHILLSFIVNISEIQYLDSSVNPGQAIGAY